MHVLQSFFEERRPDFVSWKSWNNLRVPNILEGNVSFLKNQFLASFYFYQILNLRNQSSLALPRFLGSRRTGSYYYVLLNAWQFECLSCDEHWIMNMDGCCLVAWEQNHFFWKRNSISEEFISFFVRRPDFVYEKSLNNLRVSIYSERKCFFPEESVSSLFLLLSNFESFWPRHQRNFFKEFCPSL